MPSSCFNWLKSLRGRHKREQNPDPSTAPAITCGALGLLQGAQQPAAPGAPSSPSPPLPPRLSQHTKAGLAPILPPWGITERGGAVRGEGRGRSLPGTVRRGTKLVLPGASQAKRQKSACRQQEGTRAASVLG